MLYLITAIRHHLGVNLSCIVAFHMLKTMLWLSIMKENAGLLGKVGLGGRATKRCTNNFSIAAILLWCPSSGNTKTHSMLCLDVLVQTKKYILCSSQGYKADVGVE